MIKKYITSIVLSTLAITTSAITLDECQQLAQAQYPLTAEYGLVAKTAQYDIENISKNNLPQVSAYAQATWQNRVASFPDNMAAMFSKTGIDLKGVKKDQYKIGAEVNQKLWDGGDVKSQQESRRAESEVSKAKLDVEMYQLRKRINDLFFGTLLLEAKAKQNDELQKVLSSNLSLINANVKGGTAMESDAETVKAELLSARQQRIDIEEAEKAYRSMLSIFTGKNLSNEVLEMPAMCETPNADALMRPEIRLYEAQKAFWNAQKNNVKASLMPKVRLFAQGYYGYPGYNMFDDMLHHDFSFNFMVGVKVQWNIGGLYRKKANLQKIDVAQNDISAQQEVFLFNNSIETQQEQSQISNKQRQLSADQEIIDLRTSVRKATEAKLSNGIIVVNDLVRYITDENQAKIAKSVHEIELLKSIYDLKFTTNK